MSVTIVGFQERWRKSQIILTKESFWLQIDNLFSPGEVTQKIDKQQRLAFTHSIIHSTVSLELHVYTQHTVERAAETEEDTIYPRKVHISFFLCQVSRTGAESTESELNQSRFHHI